jgi:YfiH family protein
MPLLSVKTQSADFTISTAFNQRRVAHGFFGRTSGVSTGVYESLNASFAVGDDEHNVRTNRERIAKSLGLLHGDKICTLQQVHGNQCYSVNKYPWMESGSPKGDALVTMETGIGLGILTADCAPVLFAAENIEGKGVIGAAHAGREGALLGVLEFTLVAMEDYDVHRDAITAVIGPCIGYQSYELTRGDEARFIKEDPASADYFKDGKTPDKIMFDLAGYCAHRLKRAGVKNVQFVNHDTLAIEDMYFSHRRATLLGEGAGRQMSVISLKHA